MTTKMEEGFRNEQQARQQAQKEILNVLQNEENARQMVQNDLQTIKDKIRQLESGSGSGSTVGSDVRPPLGLAIRLNDLFMEGAQQASRKRRLIQTWVEPEEETIGDAPCPICSSEVSFVTVTKMATQRCWFLNSSAQLRGHGSPKRDAQRFSSELLWSWRHMLQTRRKVWKCTSNASQAWLKFFAKVLHHR